MTSAQTHPGQGLSLPQLVFALAEELKRTAHSPWYVTKDPSWLGERYTDSLSSFTFDQVARLDQDTSDALATIREWRNSLIPINRVPLDILSLIPTHLSSQKDFLRATFVCRHWRRTFLQRAGLWSRLFISKSEAYVETFLERAMGSALDVIVCVDYSAPTLRLLSSCAERVKYLDFPYEIWGDLRAYSGPFPHLHTLRIVADAKDSTEGPHVITPPSPFPFNNVVNLQVSCVHLHIDLSQFPRLYAFPKLASLDLCTTLLEEFHASQLFDFLEASPLLQRVHLKIIATISLEGISPERVIVLPNVEVLTLITNDGGRGYTFAAHISCPSAKCTSFMHKIEFDDTWLDEIFPASSSWNAIVHQYTKSPVEEVTLEVGPAPFTCKLTFRSSDGTGIEAYFWVAHKDEERYALPSHLLEDVFFQVTRTIRNHPRLANVKRVQISHGYTPIDPDQVSRIGEEADQLFMSLGPLDELAIYCYDPRPYLHSFLDLPERCVEEPVVFPPIKKLTIANYMCLTDGRCETTIVRLAKSHHARGIPFERVTIRSGAAFAEMEERLRPWVGSVGCC
jgi:hypothetical protein